MNTKLGCAVASVAMLVAGCTPQSRNEYGQASNEAAQAIKTDANTAARATSDAANNLPNATETPKIMAALGAANGLDASRVEVETIQKNVFLKGSVPSEAQKTQVEEVAKGICGPEYQVVNQLSVAPG